VTSGVKGESSMDSKEVTQSGSPSELDTATPHVRDVVDEVVRETPTGHKKVRIRRGAR
jgi:hypothetical protein